MMARSVAPRKPETEHGDHPHRLTVAPFAFCVCLLFIIAFALPVVATFSNVILRARVSIFSRHRKECDEGPFLRFDLLAAGRGIISPLNAG
jgi:hypothetical protein